MLLQENFHHHPPHAHRTTPFSACRSCGPGNFQRCISVAAQRTAQQPRRFKGDQYFFCCGTGSFSIPFTWTQLVNSGDQIDFNLYLRTDLATVAAIVDFDATNTFKNSDISLPPGYSLTSDATGFLSQFGPPPIVIDPGTQVPEPGTLPLIGLASVLAMVVRRPGLRHRKSAPLVH